MDLLLELIDNVRRVLVLFVIPTLRTLLRAHPDLVSIVLLLGLFYVSLLLLGHLYRTVLAMLRVAFILGVGLVALYVAQGGQEAMLHVQTVAWRSLRAIGDFAIGGNTRNYVMRSPMAKIWVYLTAR